MARLVFLGSPDASVPSLRALQQAGHDVALVVSQPDRRRGRGGALDPSPVKRAALELGIPVTDRLDDVLSVHAELGVVVAYGRIIPARVLDQVPMINVHFSLLPRWRGAAPVERAILAGDRVTGVCIMRLEAGLDTGPVLETEVVDIGDDESAPALMARLADLGARRLVDTLASGVGALPAGSVQEGEPTYATKLGPEDLRLDWHRSADELARVVRLGRAWTTFRTERFRVLRARREPGASEEGRSSSPGTLVEPTLVATGSSPEGDRLRLIEVQPAGRRPQDADEWARGARPRPGEQLGDDQ